MTNLATLVDFLIRFRPEEKLMENVVCSSYKTFFKPKINAEMIIRADSKGVVTVDYFSDKCIVGFLNFSCHEICFREHNIEMDISEKLFDVILTFANDFRICFVFALIKVDPHKIIGINLRHIIARNRFLEGV